MPHWLQVLLVVAFLANVLQSIITAYDGGTLRENPSYRGEGSGGILYTLRGGTPSYTHEDKRGDVVAKTDASGSLTYQAQYEGFGQQVATNGTTLDRQKSNSKDTDPTNLVDEGFRYRDLETGMFISRDPAGFVDGPNLYTYVQQNPWTHFDPEGLHNDTFNSDGFIADWILPDPAGEAHQAGQGADAVFNTSDTGLLGGLERTQGGLNWAGHSIMAAVSCLPVAGAIDRMVEKGAVTETEHLVENKISTEAADAAPKPDKSPAPGAQPASETAPAAPDNAPPSGGCFIAGTLISTPRGEVPIETIKVGDLVWSLDIKSHTHVQRPVESVFHHVTDYWVDVTAGGEKITATRGHRFWVESLKKWVPAMDLKVGMKLLSSDGHVVGISQVQLRHLNSDRDTYNFIVGEEHDYFVGNHRYLVHNGDKVPDDKIKAPPPRRGSAPIGEDGHPMELHHADQTQGSDLDEMTRTDHRLGDNFKKNHTNTGQDSSQIDRKEFNKQKKDYWKKESDSGRFKKC